MIKTTFAGASPWDGLTVSNASKSAKEKPMAPRKKPAQTTAKAPTSVRKTLKFTNIPVGESRPGAILKEREVLAIFEAMKVYRKLQTEIKKVSPKALSEKYGISDKTLYGIEIGRSWNYLTGAKDIRRKSVKK